MNKAISCNYARSAIHHFTTKYITKNQRLPKGSVSKILHDYNQHFANNPNLKTTYTIVSKKFLQITRLFSNKWHPREARDEFITTFSTRWDRLDPTEKSSHTLRECKICKEKYQSLSQSFPAPQRTNKESKSPQISFSPDDMSTPRLFGSRLIKEANSICETHFQKSVQEVVGETPRSRLVLKPTITKRLSQKRQILREIRNTMSTEMNAEGDTLVLQNRLSWSRFDSVRKSQGLSGTKRKKPTNENDEEPTTKRKHGCNAAKLTCMIDKDELLHEAHLWEPDKQVNWSQLGQRYGLSMPNCGQVIKEYLAEQGIPAAQINQCKYKSPRRSKKRLPGGKVSFPMYKPVKKLKESH